MPPRLKAMRLASSLFLIPHTPSTAASLLAPFLVPAQQQRSASILSSLSDNKGAYNKKIRRGRGPASGKGKTAGRGQKGQHAHGKVPAGFQGGQTPLEITTPVRGRNKYNPFKIEMSSVNLDRIQEWIDQGRLDPSQPITMKELKKTRCIHGVKRHGVKLLARNVEQLKTPINIIVSRASAAAIARVEALGGTVMTRFYSPTSIKRVLRGESHPTISLGASPELIARSASPELIPTPILDALRAALAAKPAAADTTSSLSSDSPSPQEAAKHEALSAVMKQVGAHYKYRLPDATGRKDIEYYRDPAHRGYLAHLVEEGQSPSLFFKKPGEARDRKKQTARRAAAKASAENRLF